MNDIIQMIKQNDLLKIALILLGVYLFMTYTNKESDSVTEEMTNSNTIYEHLDNVESKIVDGETTSSVAPVEFDTQQAQVDAIVSGNANSLKTDDLLPKYDEANEFAKQNPVSSLLKEQNFLVSGYSMGINTVMQSNKIKNWSLRSTPPIPKENLSPWNMSSYETPSGTNHRTLEIGSY